MIVLCVQWDLPFEIWVRRRTCQGCSMCYKGKFLKCLNDAICGPWIRARVVTKEGATRERKVHPRCKDPSFLKYYVNIIISKFIFDHQVCLACEEKGFAKCCFKSKSHKCKSGGTSESMAFIRIQYFYCLDLKPVLEKQKIVENRIQTLRSLGDEFVVTKPVGLTKELFFLALPKMQGGRL